MAGAKGGTSTRTHPLTTQGHTHTHTHIPLTTQEHTHTHSHL